MTREEYFEERQNLIDQAQQLLDDEKNEGTEEVEDVVDKINALDERFEKQSKARANLEALQDKVPVNNMVKNLSMGIENLLVDNKPNAKSEANMYKNAWVKDMLSMPLDKEETDIFNKINNEYRNATQTTNTNTVLIPDTVVKGIWKEAGELFPIFGDVATTFVKGDLTLIKEVDSGADADWYNEADEVKDGDYEHAEVNLTGCELSKSISLSWKLKKMSIDEFETYITTLIAEKMGSALAKAIVEGKGKPASGDTFKAQPRGVKTALLTDENKKQIVEYEESIGYSNLTSALSKISKYVNGAVIYANNITIWSQLAEIKDTTGRPLFIPDIVNNDGIGRILGRVVKADDSIPNGEILIGNLAKGYAMNINEGVTLYTEDHVKRRITDYVSYAIVDGDVITNNAFSIITKKVTEGE